MLLVAVMLWCVASSTLMAKDVGFIYGNVFKSAGKIDLQSNVTAYTVGCKLESTGSGINSRFLGLYLNKEKVESQVINATTIEMKVDLQQNNESTVCGVKTYTCKLNQTEVHATTVFVGKPPRSIALADFRCISENREYLVCDFPRNDFCDLNTLYKLVMMRQHMPSDCELEVHPTRRIRFDSRSATCPYSAGQRSLSFELESQNFIGKTVMVFHLNHYDLVRPAAPKMLEVSNVTTTSLDIAWNLNARLINLERELEIEFSLISEYGKNESTFIIISFNVNERLNHSLQNLTPYTQYVLSIRARVIPMQLRASELDYWSDWSSATFRTRACKPSRAPVTFPGAYSLREIIGSFATVDVFWREIPRHQRNGPTFRYTVSAVDNSGQRYFPSVVNNETASFNRLKIDQYRIEISCYNDEGPADETSVMKIFPPKENLKPTIRRVLLHDGYQVSWYPASDLRNLLNYTIVYCNFTATGTCRDGVQFATVSPLETVLHIPSKQVLNFAIAAIYKDHSSDLSWQKCVVSSEIGIGQPKFSITDTSMDSFVIRMNDSCTEQSLVQRYEVNVWTKVTGSLVHNISFDPYMSVVSVNELNSGTVYHVMVTAFHDAGLPQHKEAFVRTAKNAALLQSILYLLGGLVVLAIICINASRKVKKMMNIKVDIPLGLIGIDESRDYQQDNHRKFASQQSVSSIEASYKIAQIEAVLDLRSGPTPQRRLDENSNTLNPAQVQATSTNLEGLRRTEHLAAENLYISPDQMVPTAVEKPKDNHFSGISTTSSGYVILG